MVNYANGKIYKLVCTLPDIDDIYVGGTAKPKLSDRMCCHRCEAKASKWNFKLYKFMREHGAENFKIELLEEYPCKSKKELGKREQHWIDTLKPSLNTANATCHRKEVVKRYNSKPSTKAYYREYRRKHPQKYTEEQKQRRKEYNKRRFASMSQEDRDALNAKRRARRAAKRAALI